MLVCKLSFFDDRSCMLCTTKCIPCVKNPDIPITLESDYTFMESQWKIFNNCTKLPNGKDTKEWKLLNTLHTKYQQIKLAEKKSALLNTQTMVKVALSTAAQPVQHTHPEQPKWET